MSRSRILVLIAVLAGFTNACTRAPSPTTAIAPVDHAAATRALADDYLAARLSRSPSYGYFVDMPPATHDGLEDNSLEALSEWHALEDTMLERARAISLEALEGTTEWVTLGALTESLEASVQERVCQEELWSVSQMRGWHLFYPRIAAMQPVATAEERAQALARWSKLPGYLDTEIENLKRGLDAGLSAPKSVARRVVTQLDGALALPLENDPFVMIGTRSEDAAFAEQMTTLASNEIRPAIQRYRDFLANEYVERAREELALSAQPNGVECYRAMLRGYTTLNRPPEEVFSLGKKTVDGYEADVVRLGQELYGISDFVEVLEEVRNDPSNTFSSREEVIAFARERVNAAEAGVRTAFTTMPPYSVVVEPYPAHLDGTGVSSRYERPRGDEPGVYRIAVDDVESQRRGVNERIAFHEAYPGHHLQIAKAKALEGQHPLTQITGNSAFVEGWARYSEALAEELGLYENRSALITRRAWPARGMVVDPGIHVMGWSREQAIAFIMRSGAFDQARAEKMVDRIATIPGQLTSYDSGALEIFRLRRLAEEALGGQFDLATFHDKVLENGTVPLWMLSKHVEAWIEDSNAR